MTVSSHAPISHAVMNFAMPERRGRRTKDNCSMYVREDGNTLSSDPRSLWGSCVCLLRFFVYYVVRNNCAEGSA